MQRVKNFNSNHDPEFSLLREYHQLESHETLYTVRNLPQRRLAWHLLNQCRDIKWPKGLPDQKTVRQVTFEYEYWDKNEQSIDFVRNKELPARFWSILSELFDLLNQHFIPTVPPSEAETVRDMRELLDCKDWENFDWRNCSNAVFAVHMVRVGLKYYSLPMPKSSKWKVFAQIHSGLVLAA